MPNAVHCRSEFRIMMMVVMVVMVMSDDDGDDGDGGGGDDDNRNENRSARAPRNAKDCEGVDSDGSCTHGAEVCQMFSQRK